MKVNVIGGGPGGLYAAILIKRHNPEADVSVFERNAKDSTFGFGIVLSEETLGNLDAADPESAAEIREAFTYWDDLYVDFKGARIRSTGHGYSGLERLTLLRILARRAERLGVKVMWNSTVTDYEALSKADLVIAADGVNSSMRDTCAAKFQPRIDMRSNRFVWLGSDMPLPGFTFMFRENEHGHWAVHAYQYMPGRSTFVVETTSDAFERSGLSVDSEDETANYVSRLFKVELGSHRILTNRSQWRQFPVIHCEHWHFDNVVLIGDAAHTAHFSIGSGTKLALEDVIALALSLEKNGHDTFSALAAYQEARRPRASRIQTAARSSMTWFENMGEHWKLDPLPFCLSLITRSGQITLEKLKKRDPAFAAQLAAAGYAAST